MTKSKYKQQLASPQWKARRLDILERDSHKCRFCGSKTNLQVHHLEYENLLSAWEYSDERLITLCGMCHKKQHTKPLNIKKEKAIQVYYENLMPFYKIRYNSTINVLWSIMAKLEYDTAMVHLTPSRRLEICNDLDVSNQSISNALFELKKLYVISGNNGDFMINPAIFWYGKKETRISMLLTPSIQERFNFKIED
jgi:hypothetical protein